MKPAPIAGLIKIALFAHRLSYLSIPSNAENGEQTVQCDVELNSDQNQSGAITSPNYPNQYPANIRCAYRFRSKGSERVQLTFTDFDLHIQPDQDYSSHLCRGEFDHFSAYVDLDGRMSEIDTFCGSEIPPQLMSSRNFLAAELVTHNRHGQLKRTYRGFRLIYKFTDDFGITTGRKDPKQACSFYYASSDASNGTFHSPNYPGYYPRKTECHYTFDGAPNQKVRLTFTYFDVEGFGQCDNESQSDFIEFSNYRTMDRKLPRYCGSRKPPEKGVESENDYYHVIFSSNSIFDGTGFFGFYQFINKEGKHPLRKVKSKADSVHPPFHLWKRFLSYAALLWPAVYMIVIPLDILGFPYQRLEMSTWRLARHIKFPNKELWPLAKFAVDIERGSVQKEGDRQAH